MKTFFALLTLFYLCQSISLPDVFYAETKITYSDGSMGQHDYVWVDQINNRMLSIYHQEDDVKTLLYRGDLKKEFYLHDGICGFIDAPDHLDFNLQLPKNLTLRGDVSLNGVIVKHYYIEMASNYAANYYFNLDGTPFLFEILSGVITTIDFLDFSTDVPEKTFDVPNMDCPRIEIEGVNDRFDYHDVLRTQSVGVVSPITSKASVLSPFEENLEVSIDPATLTLIGKTAWFIITDNKPEADLETIANAVIPEGATWTDMHGWKQQTWNNFQWSLTNLYGVETVRYTWGFNFLCGGQYNNQGFYIENAGALPNSINVIWGYKVNVRSSLLNPFNAGTRQFPVAGITLVMKMDSSTLISTVSQSCTVNLKGDCGTQLVNCNGYKVSEKFLYF